MKTIGLIGGMSWESTVSYYQQINEIVKKEAGSLHSAECLLYSVDFAEIEQYQSQGNWKKSGEVLTGIAVKLEQAGADFIVICTNTMHKVAPEIQAALSIPILHIAEETAEHLNKQNICKVGLLGTRYTMQEDFYKNKLIDFGIDVLIPEEQDMDKINQIIFEELCLGIISEKSKKIYLEIIAKLNSAGAEGVILGCTEIGLLVKSEDMDVPLFDTAKIHAESAALYALN
ncbi:aspartate/glutamate racemase family protein [Enterococcus sp. BWB1-3]|uniref:aspartate/glutamate racemase family protein n=1 Tax=unclassified Enterococcus TaxID=2608891 RepID=UPI001921200A|nr:MULTISPECIES: aspartate/glutamate racemase family protein [unclassified Enterococcus]MBL1227790.1 aspartate/glutamate racemase family protein [Enterococcus sp. BWB1-3]MCB5952022.1 aspartate/glutamate racemase family protein [Enterococcus sp. BWT-B8]